MQESSSQGPQTRLSEQSIPTAEPLPTHQEQDQESRSGHRVRALEPVEINRFHTYRLQLNGTVVSYRTVIPKEEWLQLITGNCKCMLATVLGLDHEEEQSLV